MRRGDARGQTPQETAMPDEACPLPSRPGNTEADAVRRMLAAKRVAVVGLSDDPSRASHGVASYLASVGKEIIPVNPNHATVMGLKCYAALEDVPGPIDVVDVFRRPEFCADVVRSAVAVGAKGVWLQSGIVSEEARRVAREAGIDFVQNRCMKVDHMFGAP
jgi:predicted CoA-binding protein